MWYVFVVGVPAGVAWKLLPPRPPPRAAGSHLLPQQGLIQVSILCFLYAGRTQGMHPWCLVIPRDSAGAPKSATRLDATVRQSCEAAGRLTFHAIKSSTKKV